MIETLTKPITGYKKVYSKEHDSDSNHVVATLCIPAGAVVRMGTNKCRTSVAFVSDMTLIGPVTIKGCGCQYCEATHMRRQSGDFPKPHASPARSSYDSTFDYALGTVVRPTKDFNLGDLDCAEGIHFFRTFEEAAEYHV